MTNRFIPKNVEQAEALKARLSGGIFRDPATFVEYYNNGIINRANPDAKDLVQELVKTFKDVREQKGKLTFISENEILVREMQYSLRKWAVLVRVKREIQEALEEHIIALDSPLFIISDSKDSSKIGFICTLDTNDEGESIFVNIGGERLKTIDEDDLTTVLKIRENNQELGYTNNNELGYTISVQDVLNVDDSFITLIKDEIPA